VQVLEKVIDVDQETKVFGAVEVGEVFNVSAWGGYFVRVSDTHIFDLRDKILYDVSYGDYYLDEEVCECHMFNGELILWAREII